MNLLQTTGGKDEPNIVFILEIIHAGHTLLLFKYG